MKVHSTLLTASNTYKTLTLRNNMNLTFKKKTHRKHVNMKCSFPNPLNQKLTLKSGSVKYIWILEWPWHSWYRQTASGSGWNLHSSIQFFKINWETQKIQNKLHRNQENIQYLLTSS